MKQSELAEIKKAVWDLLKPQIEKLLNGFQKDLVGGQHRLNAVWNTMNVFIRVLTEKGLVTEAEFIAAGEALAREAQMNVTTVQVTAAQGRRVKADAIIASPMDKATSTLTVIYNNNNNNNNSTKKADEHVNEEGSEKQVDQGQANSVQSDDGKDRTSN